MDQIEPTRVTNWLEKSVTLLQTVIAAFLVVLLVLGVFNLGLTIATALFAYDVTGPNNVVSLMRSAIDIVLYLSSLWNSTRPSWPTSRPRASSWR